MQNSPDFDERVELIRTTAVEIARVFEDDNSPSALIEALKDNTSVRCLELQFVDTRNLVSFCHMVQEKNNMTELSLWHCTVNQEGSVALCELLKTNRGLRKLNLLSCVDFDEDAFRKTCEGLQMNFLIEHVHMFAKSLNVEEVTVLGRIIEQSRNVTTWQILSVTFQDSRGWRLIGGSLSAETCCIRDLNLTGSSVAVEYMVHGLRKNKAFECSICRSMCLEQKTHVKL